jgi:ornithine cyclodeaminase
MTASIRPPSPPILSADECEALLDLPRLLEEIAQGFIDYTAGRVTVPPVGHLGFSDPPGDVHIKYGHVRDDAQFVIKIATGFPGNSARSLPTGDGLMLVFDAHTGLLGAVLLDRGRLTDLRTAAAGAVAARALAPADVMRIGIIGTGVQARLQLRMLSLVTECRRVLVWGRDPARAAAYSREAAGDGFDVAVAPTAESLAAQCNLIVTTTASHSPLFPASAVQAGTHITAVGADAPGKQELDPSLVARADVLVADSIAQCAHHGELSHALERGLISRSRVTELGAVLSDSSQGRTDQRQITLCDLTGVAVQDIIIAEHVLRASAERACL